MIGRAMRAGLAASVAAAIAVSPMATNPASAGGIAGIGAGTSGVAAGTSLVTEVGNPRRGYRRGYARGYHRGVRRGHVVKAPRVRRDFRRGHVVKAPPRVYHRPRVVHRPYVAHRPKVYYRNDTGAAVAAGVIGLAAGAIVGSALAAPPQRRIIIKEPVHGYPAPYSAEWYRLCDRKYRSFRASDGTYLGYDGHRHVCRIP